MHLTMDSDLQAVAQFMQEHIPAARLVNVAAGMAGLAPLLWGHYEREGIEPVKLSAHGLRTQSDAIVSPLDLKRADGDFEAA